MRQSLSLMAVIFFAVLTVSCQTLPDPQTYKEQSLTVLSDAELEEMLVGVWYGKNEEGGGNATEFISTRRADGTFSVDFRHSDASGFAFDRHEQGAWSVQDRTYKTITREVEGREVDTNDPFFNDTYEIISISENSFEYKQTTLGVTYSAQRMADDFTFSPLEEPRPQTRIVPKAEAEKALMEFDETMRANIERVGALFVESFDRICSETNFSAAQITATVEGLGWSIGQTRPSEVNVRRWTSLSFEKLLDANNPAPPLILDIIILPTDETQANSCSITTWGNSSAHEIGKAEFELIAANYLSEKYVVQEMLENRQQIPSPIDSRKFEILTYSTKLKNQSSQYNYDYFYHWRGGTHTLTVLANSE